MTVNYGRSAVPIRKDYLMSQFQEATAWWGRVRTAVLTTLGFGSLTGAAWLAWGAAAFFAAGGVACLVLEYLGGDG